MAMRAEDDALCFGHPLAHRPEQRGVLRRRRITDRIRQIDGGRAFCDGGGHNST